MRLFPKNWSWTLNPLNIVKGQANDLLLIEASPERKTLLRFAVHLELGWENERSRLGLMVVDFKYLRT